MENLELENLELETHSAQESLYSPPISKFLYPNNNIKCLALHLTFAKKYRRPLIFDW